mgnify:CR=1 FL=1
MIQKPWKKITSRSTLSCIDQESNLQYQIILGSFNKQNFISACKNFNFKEKSIILMDNVKFHHSKDVIEFFKSKNIDILFVPPYSPWFNPIENVFSLIKKQFYKTGLIDSSFKSVKCKNNTLSNIFNKSIHLK